MANNVCGVNAAIAEAKAGIDSLKDKIAGGLNSIGDIGGMADTIKNKLSEVNLPQGTKSNLQEDLAALVTLSPEEYSKAVEDIKTKFGTAVPDLDKIIEKVPKPVGTEGTGAKDIFADFKAAVGGVGAAVQKAQEQLANLSFDSVLADICKDVPNLEVEETIETRIIVDPQDPNKTIRVVVPVYGAAEEKPTSPVTPSSNPTSEKKPEEPPAKGFTFAFTEAKLVQATNKNAAQWFSYLATMLPKYNITTPERVAAFVANVTVETGWNKIEEDGRYSAKTLYEKLNPKKSRFPTLADAEALVQRGREAIMNVIYANRMSNGTPESGDGFKYRGRGLKQLTGKDNYTRASKAFFGDDRLLKNPDIVINDKNCAVETGCWYYKTTNIQAYADKKDWGACASLVNFGRPDGSPGSIFGYAERVNLAERAYKVFKG